MSSSGRQDSLMMQTLEQREVSTSLNDIMIRRLKNRERQRRYRARKRLEADSKKSLILKQSSMPQAEMEFNVSQNNLEKRILCKRDWKKEARKAHIHKAEDDMINSCVKASVTKISENQITCLPSRSDGEVPAERESHLDNSLSYEMYNKFGVRDWKASARNKKN